MGFGHPESWTGQISLDTRTKHLVHAKDGALAMAKKMAGKARKWADLRSLAFIDRDERSCFRTCYVLGHTKFRVKVSGEEAALGIVKGSMICINGSVNRLCAEKRGEHCQR